LGYLQVVYTMVVITLCIHYISSKFLDLSNFKRSVSVMTKVTKMTMMTMKTMMTMMAMMAMTTMHDDHDDHDDLDK